MRTTRCSSALQYQPRADSPFAKEHLILFSRGKRALLVLLAPPRGGSSSAGTDGPGRESRRDGSSRQTAREGKTTPRRDNLPVSPSVPAQHRAGSALELPIPWLPPGGMLRRGTRSGPRMVLGWRRLWVTGDAAPSPDLQRWIQPKSFNQRKLPQKAWGDVQKVI